MNSQEALNFEQIIIQLTNLIFRHFENRIQKIEAMMNLIEEAPENQQNQLFFHLLQGYRCEDNINNGRGLFYHDPLSQRACQQLEKEIRFLFFLKYFPQLPSKLRAETIWAFIHTKQYAKDRNQRLVMLTAVLESKNNNHQQ